MNDGRQPLTPLWPTAPDERFGLVERPSPNSAWSASLWVVDTSPVPVCVYGWAIPRPSAPSKPWSHVEVRKVGRISLWRLTCTATHSVVQSLLHEISRGASLAEAAARVGHELPGRLPCGTLRISTDTGDATHTPAPWTFYPTRTANDGEPHARARASPNPEAPAIGTSLLALDKPSLGDRVEAASSGLLAVVLQELESETGLSFLLHDAERLGDIEMFVFPAAFADDEPRARVRHDPHPIVDIDVPDGTPLVVRCEQRAGSLIVADETLILTGRGAPECVEFAATPDGPHTTTVQIWAGKHGGLWFSGSLVSIRTISMTGHLLGPTLSLNSQWLAEWARDHRHAAAAEKMKLIKRPSVTKMSTIGEPDAEFVAASRRARQWLSSRQLEPTGARFFGAQERLQFATWLRAELAAGQDLAAVALFDPYIDRWGLELFSRVETDSCLFEIVTTLRRGAPGATEATAGEAGVRTNLTAALAALSIPLGGLRLRVHAFAGDRPFHDRIILAYGTRGNVLRGYHLSNSLDGATVQYPLLVTPIPDDVLSAVVDDYARMMELSDGTKETLYDSAKGQLRPTPGPLAPPATLSLDAAIEALLVAGPADILTCWCALAASIVATEPRPDPDRLFASIAKRSSSAVADALSSWLSREALAAPLPVGVADVPSSRAALELITSYLEDFPSASRSAVRYAEHYHRHAGAPFPLDYAVRFLVHNAPEAFVRAVDVLAEVASAAGADSAESGRVGAILVSATSHLAPSLVLGTTDELRLACLRARNPFLRALAAAAVGETLAARYEAIRVAPERALDLIAVMQHDERLLAVGTWIGELGADMDRGDTSGEAAREARACAIARVIEWWNPQVDPSLLPEVVRRCEGSHRGRWARVTMDQLLGPLIAKGKVDGNVVARTWIDLLAERMLADAAGSVRFDSSSDISLTETAAGVLAAHGAGVELALFEKTAKQARRAVTRPFARTDYRRFSNAAHRLLWLEAFARLLQGARVVGPHAEAACRLLGAAYDVPRRALDDLLAYGDASGLAGFVLAVRGRQAGPEGAF